MDTQPDRGCYIPCSAKSKEVAKYRSVKDGNILLYEVQKQEKDHTLSSSEIKMHGSFWLMSPCKQSPENSIMYTKLD